MAFNKTLNAKRNSIWGLFQKILLLLIPFFTRTIIIYTLGNLYLGLNSLFSSILNTLNLAELGVGSALIFSMYQPIEDNDKIKIMALMNVYKKVYFIIGVIVLSAGLLVAPFLRHFISGDIPNDINIYIVYLIQLISIVLGYFLFSYKGSVLYAFQRFDIICKVNLIFELLTFVLQLTALLVFKSYYLFIGSNIVKILLQNLTISIIVNKKYPDLKAAGDISKKEKKNIATKTGALFAHKVASVVINSIDNVLLSVFMGLEIVAIYNNYMYIITAVSGIFIALLDGMSSIVGNYLITKKEEEITSLFNTIHYIICGMICVCCTCFITLYQPFISFWVGESSLLPFYMVILFVSYFFIVKIRSTCTLFQGASGIWEKDVPKAYLLVLIDLVIDLILLKTIGIAGAIISSIVSMLFAFVYEMIVTFKYCLKTKYTTYILYSLFYLLITVFSCSSGLYITNMIHTDYVLLQLLINLFLSVGISFALFIGITSLSKIGRSSSKYLLSKLIRKDR